MFLLHHYNYCFNSYPCYTSKLLQLQIYMTLLYSYSHKNKTLLYSYSHKNKTLLFTFLGSRFGLSLTLNIEQYEYMLGPQSDAGIKVFLHSKEELPQVRDLGFAIPPGTHALVGARLNEVSDIISHTHLIIVKHLIFCYI